MTRKEVTELFSVMLLAWPNAEMFKGGVQKLGPTIELWAKCLPDVDFWTGQQALIRLCKVCKYPPTIAEFREQVDAVNYDIRQQTEFEWAMIRTGLSMGRTPEQVIASLPAGFLAHQAIKAMGGAAAIIQESGLLNHSGFEKAFRNTLKACDKSLGEYKQITGSGSQQTVALPNGDQR